MKLLNNTVLIKLDDHYDRILDSSGNPFLFIDTQFEAFNHCQTSGKVVATCETLTKDYMYGTTMDIKEGDTAIFHYLAISRDRDGQKIIHTKMIGDDYIIKYSDIFAVIREGELIMINGFVLLEGEPEEWKSNLIIPDYLKKKQSKVVCTIKRIGKAISYNNSRGDHSIDFEDDPDDFNVGDKVLVPAWSAIPIMRQEHSIIDPNKIYYRSQRRWMTHYDWAMDNITEWQKNNTFEESNESELNAKAYNDFIRQGSQDDGKYHPTVIKTKQYTKYKKEKSNKFYMGK